jgi:Uma2 family endonuclease
MATAASIRPITSPGELKKLLVDLLPDQGHWSEEDYLWLMDHTSRLVEYTDGNIEALPMPTERHQSILEFLFVAFLAYLQPLGGKVHTAGIRLRVRPRKFREPDLILLRSAKDPRRQNRYWSGADLALEVVSKDKPERDLVDKRGDYAEAEVPEYWIVNPITETITVLRLEGDVYVEHGVFGRGATAASALLAGFTISVNAVMDAD